jgi:nucleotide-binding universal stress UspA family protein
VHTGPILLGIDDSARRHDAVALAGVLARALDAPVLIAHVHAIDPFAGAASERYAPQPSAEAQALVTTAAEALGPDVATETLLLVSGSPTRGLYDLARARDARLLVLGSCRRGALGRLLLGSVAAGLLHGCPCPVAVAPPGYGAREHAPPRRIGVGYNGSAEADLARDFAAALAERCDADLLLWLVVARTGNPRDERWRTYRTWLRDWSAAQLDRGLAAVPAGVRAEADVLEGDPPDVLADLGAGADLLAVGSRGYGPARRVLLGGTSAALLRRAPCPIVVLPRGVEPA